MKYTFLLFFFFAFGSATQMSFPSAYAYAAGVGCGTMCMAEINNFCPTCNRGFYSGPNMSPWGAPYPWWWQTGPMMYSNFYQPAPWYQSSNWNNYYAPSGVMPSYYPGTGGMMMGKPNLYIEGPAGTPITIKMKFTEQGANWLATVPSHGTQGWKGTLEEKGRIRTDQGIYGFLFSDYRVNGFHLQDREGFCSTKKNVLGKMAISLNRSGFTGREIADFLEYWSVKFPQAERYCVYPQDERQLATVADLEVTPKPASIRRLLFMVQLEENLGKSAGKFTKAPVREWNPQPVRALASDKNAIKIREWGVGFFAAKSR